jgi:XTP/dITP diphosphohydrolase
MKPSDTFEDLVDLIAILRKECSWDRRQTHDSIKDNLIEEAYEAVEAIDEKDYDELSRELGDLMLHIVFQSKIASEHESFTIQDVIYNISEKLIRRHPHVFGETVTESDTEVAKNWESIKLSEGRESVLDGVPKHLPALIKAQRMQEKASNVGFDWDDWELAWKKLEEELEELKQSIKNQKIEEQQDEFGDVLFSFVNVGRLLGLRAEEALRGTNKKFDSRFRYIEDRLREKDKPITESSLDEMDQYWNEAKKRE